MKNYTLGLRGQFFSSWGEAPTVKLPCAVRSHEADFLMECHDANDLQKVLEKHATAPGVSLDIEACLAWALEDESSVLNASQVRSGGHNTGGALDDDFLIY